MFILGYTCSRQLSDHIEPFHTGLGSGSAQKILSRARAEPAGWTGLGSDSARASELSFYPSCRVFTLVAKLRLSSARIRIWAESKPRPVWKGSRWWDVLGVCPILLTIITLASIDFMSVIRWMPYELHYTKTVLKIFVWFSPTYSLRYKICRSLF